MKRRLSLLINLILFMVCVSGQAKTRPNVLFILTDDREIDGINLWPLIGQKVATRNKPIGFLSQSQEAWIGERYKIYSKKGKTFQLYDLTQDRAEKTDLSDEFPEVKARMLNELNAWKKTVMADKAQCEPMPKEKK